MGKENFSFFNFCIKLYFPRNNQKHNSTIQIKGFVTIMWIRPK